MSKLQAAIAKGSRTRDSSRSKGSSNLETVCSLPGSKDVFDILVGLALALLLWPVFVGVSLLVFITSGFPILHRQEREGLGGKRFMMWKFRTMVVGAESNQIAVWSVEGDSRCTALGRGLRRAGLDELPQIVHVLGRKMSLVGPRPERPFFAERFRGSVPGYRQRSRARPGLTGLAQVLGFRGDTEIEPRADMDNWYIENWHFDLDLLVLFVSFAQIVCGPEWGRGWVVSRCRRIDRKFDPAKPRSNAATKGA